MKHEVTDEELVDLVQRLEDPKVGLHKRTGVLRFAVDLGCLPPESRQKVADSLQTCVNYIMSYVKNSAERTVQINRELGVDKEENLSSAFQKVLEEEFDECYVEVSNENEYDNEEDDDLVFDEADFDSGDLQGNDVTFEPPKKADQ